MDEFSIAEKEIQQKRQQRLDEVHREVQTLTETLQERLPPVRLLCNLQVKSRTESGWDDQDRRQDTEVFDGMLLWKEYPIGISWKRNERLPTVSQQGVGSSLDQKHSWKDDHRYASALQAGNEQATVYLRQRLAALVEEESKPGIMEMRARLTACQNEIAIFEGTVDLSIPIYLAEQGVSEQGRQALIVEAKKYPYFNVRTQYHPRYPSDPLREFGAAATQRWYALQGIDLAPPVIDFSTGKYGDVTLDQLEGKTAEAQRLHRQLAEQTEREDARLTEQTEREQRQREADRVAEDARLQREGEKKQIQEELTPEHRKHIEEKIAEVRALLQILQHVPSDTAEGKKFVKQLPEWGVSGVEDAYRSGHTGLATLSKLDTLTNQTLREFANREKINREVPELWKRALGLLAQWKSIRRLVQEDEHAGVVIDGGGVTPEELAARVAAKFLSHPWETAVQNILREEVRAIVESL